ncbi:MAG: GNAT family N-acetyltransferase [Tumebacillaceae bacterium]
MVWVETERLRLIHLTQERIQALIESPQKLGELLGMNVAAEWPIQDFAEVLPWLAGLMEKQPSLCDWAGLLVHKADNALMGDMGFKSSGPDESGMVEFGYSIAPDYRGHGYATEMAKGLVAWALEQPGVTQVTAECLPDNIGSIRVLEKTGLQQLALDGDMLKWEIRK